MRPTQSASIMAYTSPLFSSAAVIEETEAEQPLDRDNYLSGPNAERRPRRHCQNLTDICQRQSLPIPIPWSGGWPTITCFR